MQTYGGDRWWWWHDLWNRGRDRGRDRGRLMWLKVSSQFLHRMRCSPEVVIIFIVLLLLHVLHLPLELLLPFHLFALAVV